MPLTCPPLFHLQFLEIILVTNLSFLAVFEMLGPEKRGYPFTVSESFRQMYLFVLRISHVRTRLLWVSSHDPPMAER